MATGDTAKKTIRSTKLQVNYLLDYMKNHPEFAFGESQTPSGQAKSNQKWAQLKEALDKLGPHRSVSQWKICWRDQKRKVKAEGFSPVKPILPRPAVQLPQSPVSPPRRRIRPNHPSEQFINAQLELNQLIMELIGEVRRGNQLREEHLNFLRARQSTCLSESAHSDRT